MIGILFFSVILAMTVFVFSDPEEPKIQLVRWRIKAKVYYLSIKRFLKSLTSRKK